MIDLERRELAEFILDHTVDGDHHKAWVLDQLLRMLLADEYQEIIDEFREVYRWEEGIAP